MFKSDNISTVHPKIMEAIVNANLGHASPYGNDTYTEKAIESLKKAFNRDVDVYLVGTGTAANVIGLNSILSTIHAVICTDTAHINVDETGALEAITGSKIIYVPNENGKLTIERIRPYLNDLGNEHKVQPKVISISQSTEIGTLYTVDEIRELADFAHENNMYLHVDGSRIANAIVSLDSSYEEMISETGVDLFAFGGTKNGMMIGEAIISFNKEISKNLKFFRKQNMQLFSKMRYVAAQFPPYLEEGIWRENAERANEMGQYLYDKLKNLEGIRVHEGLKTNMIFGNMEDYLIENLMEEYGFYHLNKDTNLVRFVTSFDTEKEDIDNLIEAIRELNNSR